MKIQSYPPVGLASLGSLLIFMSGCGLAGSTSSSMAPSGCVPTFVADGDCDGLNNNEECGYDGGDCCACTCVSTEAFTCGVDGGFACVDPSAACVDDDDVTTYRYSDDAFNCIGPFLGDGDCDEDNNNAQCGYDDGDCCECTCVSTTAHTCGDIANGGFECLDPRAPCTDDDDGFFFDDDMTGSFSYDDSCIDGAIGDGDCDELNNNEACDYDGGDCCECTCESTVPFSCGDDANYDCIDPTAPCVNTLVEAGTKTTVGVSSNGYDTRPGEGSGGSGCLEDGCEPGLTRDGVSADVESRWSCSQAIVEGERLCKIDFTFEDPQDIVDVEVAFWKGDERDRTLEVEVNSDFVADFDSYAGLTFNTFSLNAQAVSTLGFKAVGLDADEWISLIEVRFLVEP